MPPVPGFPGNISDWSRSGLANNLASRTLTGQLVSMSRSQMGQHGLNNVIR